MPKIYVVATPIGNLSDISFRAIETLRNSDIIAAEDTRNTQKLLNHYNIQVKTTSYHKFNEVSKSDVLIKKIIENDLVLSIVSDAGTPCISDPGSKIIDLARKNNIDVFVIPGACAAVGALSISGFEINEFSFFGFLPRKNEEQKKKLKSIRSKSEIAILYESPKRIIQLLQNIFEIDDKSIICVCNDLTKIYEKSMVAPIQDILEYINNDKNSDKGEYCLVIKWSIQEDNYENNKILLETLIFEMLYKNKTRQEIFNELQIKGYKRNQIYNSFENVKIFINNKH